jgi:hypothetical protein
MQRKGCDRSILKAFYTQYVAVLLIILTFAIGAFQRSAHIPVAAALVESRYREMAPIGEFVVTDLFSDDGSVYKDNPQLRALSAVVNEHDVTLEVDLSFPRLTFVSDSASLRRALRRIQSLEHFFEQQEVPLSSVHFRVKPAESHSNSVTVRVVPEEVR